MKYIPLILLCLVTGLGIESCVNHNIELEPVIVECDGYEPVSFNADIKDDIIMINCAIKDCHNGDNGTEINWTVFSNFQAHADEVKRRLTLPVGHPDKMPRKGSLTYDQIKTIVCWVEQGAKDN